MPLLAVHDVRYALRRLTREWRLTFVAVSMLSVGIGVGAAIFALVNAVLLRPFPFTNPHELVTLVSTKGGSDVGGLSSQDVADYEQEYGAFESVASYLRPPDDAFDPDGLTRFVSVAVSPRFFETLGVGAAVGRTFGTDDAGRQRRLVVISYGFWQQRFGGRPDIVGQNLRFDDASFTIVGVMPRSFTHPDGLPADTWSMLWDSFSRTDRRNRVVARLRAGVGMPEAQHRVDVVSSSLERRYPQSNQGWGARVVSLNESALASVRRPLLVLLWAVIAVLVITCANVTTIWLTRQLTSQADVSLRFALGASRRRVLAQLGLEGLLLIVPTGIGALLVAMALIPTLGALAPVTIPRAAETAADGRVFAFTAAAVLIGCSVVGFLPVAFALRTPERLIAEVDRLRPGARTHRLCDVFIVVQVGLAVVLMIGAGLTLVSLLRLYRVDAGFPIDHLLVVQLRTGAGVSPSGPNMALIYQNLRRTLGEIPGVRAVGAAKALPMARHQQPIETQLWRAPESDAVTGEWTVVVPGLFETLELPVLAGRSLQPVDDTEARNVALINEALAIRLFGSASEAVDRSLRTSGAIQHATVVGVVRNVTSPMRDVVPTLYVPASNTLARLGITLALRVGTDPAAVAPLVRQAIRTAYPGMTVLSASALTDDVAETMRYPRFLAMLLNTFGAMGLLIAASGIHGIAAYAVTRRRYEIGVRMAFGADPRSIVRMLVGRAAFHVAVGTALGVLAAALLGRALTGALYGVSASNPAVFGSVAAISLAVGLLASYVPSRRAAMIPLGMLLRE